MKSKASAIWEGNLKQGLGHISSNSSVLRDVPYTYKARFEGAEGTTPEELIAAAHAGCFSMAFSNILDQAGFTPERVATEAVVTLEPKDGAPTVTKSHLTVSARVPGISEEAFMKAANDAKAGCPISRLLNTDISMDARLET